MDTVDRCWLLTWTTYGTWLPGDERGFVGPVRLADGTPETHNRPRTDYDRDLPKLKATAEAALKSPPVRLTHDQAISVANQIQSTAAHRAWRIFAVAVMSNHVHVVVGVTGDPEPADILRDLKSYVSRELNRVFSPACRKRWWTESGSKRKLPDESAVIAAVNYVKRQTHPLALWAIPGERSV